MGGHGTHLSRSNPGSLAPRHPVPPWGTQSWKARDQQPTPLKERRSWPPSPLHPLWPAHPGLWPPRAHRGPSPKLAKPDLAVSPKAPKFPRNTSSPLGRGHPSCPQTENRGHRGLPTPRGPGEPAASARCAAEPATAPRALAALRGGRRRGSPESASLQWDQSGKRDLAGQRGRRAEGLRSPLES